MLEPVLTRTMGDVIKVNKSQSKDHKIVMIIIESSNKIHKPKLYEEAVNNPVHRQQWREVIEEELQNLENHQTWIYNKLPHDRKVVGSKWVFKVKYNTDRLVTRFKARLVAQCFS